jgi:hypothetical protein
MSELKHVYHLSALFKKAWGIARHNAKHQGGGPRFHLAQALRQAWGEAKAAARQVAEERTRVLAEVERIRALHTPEATAARAAQMADFALRFLPARRSYGRRYA